MYGLNNTSFIKAISKQVWALVVCALLFLPVNASARNEGVEVTVTDPFAEIHTGPGRGYPVFHVVEKGNQIRLFKRKNDWFKVETFDGKLGWIHRKQLVSTLTADNTLVDFSAASREDYLVSNWEIGVLGGDFSGAQGLTTYVGYHLTQNISAELKYTQAFGDFSNSKLYSINAVHKLFPNWNATPFFTLGTGVITIEPSSDLVQTEDRKDSVLTVGAGFFIYLSRNFLIRLEYNDHTLLTTRDTNEEVDEWKAGFSIFF